MIKVAKTLSNKQVADINGLIQDAHLALMVELGGPQAVSHEDLERLTDRGMVHKGGASLLRRAYEYGILAGSLGPDGESQVSPGSFMAFLNSAAASLTLEDQRTIQAVTDHMEAHVNGFALDLQRRFQLALNEADKHLRRMRQHVVGRVTSEGAARGESVREIALKLRKATKDAGRDWMRVASTELHNLVQEGKAAAIQKNTGGNDPRVFKRPKPDACAYCKILYLESDGVTPRVFRLSDLVANGSNQGRKANRPTLSGPAATEWKPTLDSVHPFCQCELHEMPDGMAFGDNGKLVHVGLKKAQETAILSPLDRLLLNHECVD